MFVRARRDGRLSQFAPAAAAYACAMGFALRAPRRLDLARSGLEHFLLPSTCSHANENAVVQQLHSGDTGRKVGFQTEAVA